MDFPQPGKKARPRFEPANFAGKEAAANTALLLDFLDSKHMGDAGHRNFAAH
jgi:hypothetical protein